MWDSMVRAIASDNSIRVSAVVSTKLVDEVRKRHKTLPVATAALGRVLSSTLLLTWGLKEEGTITLRILGDGPLGGIIADANANGEVRGYIQNPMVDLPLNTLGKLDVGGGVGKGSIYVTKDIGLGEPYTGSVPLKSGEIGEDVANYLVKSEQTPSLVAVGVLVNPDLSTAASGGIIIQALPGASEDELIKIENNAKALKPISTLINEGLNARDLLQAYLKDVDIKILDEKPVLFKCKCNRERTKNILKSLGKDELLDILNKEGKSEVRCHFCNEAYLFSKNDLEELIAEIQGDK